MNRGILAEGLRDALRLQKKRREARHVLVSAIECLESRVLMSVTTNITGETADRGVYSDGTLPFIAGQTQRVGDNGTNTLENVYVTPFKLPALPTGAVITSANVAFQLQGVSNGASISGGADVYGLGYRTTNTVLSTDYFEGAYNTDATDATAIMNNFAIKTTPAGSLTLDSGGQTSLASYLTAQYAAGAAANNFVFLRINAESDQMISRFWTFYTSDSTTTAFKPVLTFTYETVPTAPSNLSLLTTSNSNIQLNWQDNSSNETSFGIERSTNGVTFTSAGTVGANVTTFTDSGLSADTTYYYRVFATNSGVNSAPTAVQSDTTIPTFTHTLWVDKSFAGTSTGTFLAPYKTIASAITASVSGDGVVIRGGTYTETAAPKTGTTLMSESNERVILSGFGAISGWTLVSGNLYTTTVNFNPTTLYVNNSPQDLSRSPNEGWYDGETVVQDTVAKTATITDVAHLAGIPSLTNAYLQVHTAADNNFHGAKIVSHDTVNGVIVVSTVSGGLGVMVNNDRYIIKNTLNLLDRDGEWASIDAGGGNFNLYFRTANVADLSATQYRKTGSQQINVSGKQDVVIRGLEVKGNTGFGINVGGNSSNITIRDSIFHNNGNNGINVRYAANITTSHNIATGNGGDGILYSSVTGGLLDGNEVSFNTIDGMDIVGDISGKLPTDPLFVPTTNVTASNNYIHHQLGYSHSDGIQMYNTVQNVKLLNNFLTANGQNLMTEEVDGGELGGNIFNGSNANNVIFGHNNSNNWNIHNNTITASGGSPYNFTGTGYTVNENITIEQVAIPSVTGNVYSGDRNLYYAPGGYLIRTTTPSKGYTTVAAFTADYPGKDANSAAGDPLFANASSVDATYLENWSLSTANTFYVHSVANFAVGDHIQINDDGVVRTVTAVNTTLKTITFDVAIPGKPIGQFFNIENWKTKTNFNYDFTLATGSPGKTLGATGGPVGSTVNAANYIAGDFNGDGKRDLPTFFSDIAIGLPSPTYWVPPSY